MTRDPSIVFRGSVWVDCPNRHPRNQRTIQLYFMDAGEKDRSLRTPVITNMLCNCILTDIQTSIVKLRAVERAGEIMAERKEASV